MFNWILPINKQIKKYDNQAHQALENWQYDKAIQLFTKLGELHTQQLNYEQAITYFSQAYELSKTHDTYEQTRSLVMQIIDLLILTHRHIQAAEYYEKIADHGYIYSECIEYYKSAIKLYENAYLHLSRNQCMEKLGHAYINFDEYPAAMNIYQWLYNHNPDSRVFYIYMLCYLIVNPLGFTNELNKYKVQQYTKEYRYLIEIYQTYNNRNIRRLEAYSKIHNTNKIIYYLIDRCMDYHDS